MNREMSTITPGIYKHYKKKNYKVLCEATHSESGETVVVYQCLYGDNSIWVRPKEMFFELVAVDGIKIPRFAYVSAVDEK